MMNKKSSSERIEWMHKPIADSFTSAQWVPYSDVEVSIIEECYQNKQSSAQLDNFELDLNNLLHIPNENPTNRYPVKRVSNRQVNGRLRESRFIMNPLSSTKCFKNARDRSSFLDAAGQYYKLTFGYDTTVLQMLVEKAAEGILIEGTELDREKEGQWLSSQLLKVKNRTHKEVAECCARLYCMESFLYKTLNETMRLGIDGQYEAMWRSKIPTLGPFACLLFNLHQYQHGPISSEKTITVYRGANMTSDLIEEFRQHSAQTESSRIYAHFPAFTSTSRNMEKAGMFGNVLFIIEINEVDGCDISFYSEFDEEEYLLNPHFYFSIKSCIFDEQVKKWIITLRSLNL